MPALQEWLSANRPLILFVYGQVFFVMGIAILLQSRRYSRLELARSLPWLAAFGITHGLYEWAGLFIPIQAAFLPDPIVQGLHAAESILLALSFACLMRFGVELLRPFPARWRWLPFGPTIVFILWLIGPFWIGLQLATDLTVWHAIVDALARYFIGFPGALLAAYGLRWHAQRHIAPLNSPHIYRTLRIAGLALGIYAVLSGLIVRPAPFFPANTLNSDWLATLIVVPVTVLRSITAIIFVLAMIRALEVFELETDQLIEQMEEAQAAAIERERIGRDLHDGAIQRVYAAGLLAESLRKKADGAQADGLDRLMQTLNEAIADLRHYLSDLRTDHAADLSAVLHVVVQEAQRASSAQIHCSIDPLPTLPPDRLTHVASFAREAISNAVRHSQAHVIDLSAHSRNNHLMLIVHDDGRGFKLDVPRGYGLRNMRDRARLLGGEVTFDSTPGKGTTITLSVPVEREA